MGKSVWDRAEVMHRSMETQGKGVFVTLHGEDFFVRSVEAEDKDISLLKADSPQYGDIKEEIICDTYALVGTEDPKEISYLLYLLTNEECYEEFRYVEIADDYNSNEHSTFLAVPIDDPLPLNATGRYLKFNCDTCEFYFV